MGRSHHALADQLSDLALHYVFLVEVKVGRGRCSDSVLVYEVLTRSQVVAAAANHVDQVALGFKAEGGYVLDVVHQADHGDGRGREDRLDLVADRGLVVEADVSAGHRGFELQTGLAHTLDGADELPVHLGVVGIAKVEAVGDGAGGSARAGDVAGVLGHRDHRTHLGVGVHVSAVAVHGHGQGAVGSAQVDDRRVAGGVGRAVDGSDH